MVGEATVGGAWSRRWVRVVLRVVVVALLAADGGALYLRRGPEAVTVDSALERFRRDNEAAGAGADGGAAGPTETTAVTAPPVTASGAPAAPGGAAGPGGAKKATPGGAPQGAGPAPAPTRYGAPPVGVYVYRTTGYEETDALSGARHDYPPETTLTVKRKGCGWTERWQPLEQRWDEIHMCTSPKGRLVVKLTTFHEFFQRTQQQDNTCPPDSVHVPASAAPGTTVSFVCEGSYGKMAFSGRVMGTEPVEVAGRPVAALRVRLDMQFSGSNRGSGMWDNWLDERGVLVKRIWDIDIATDSPFGTVRYKEHYTITLASPDPRT